MKLLPLEKDGERRVRIIEHRCDGSRESSAVEVAAGREQFAGGMALASRGLVPLAS